VDDLVIRHAETVQPAWIDYNGHMNVAYYVLAFDHATDAFLDAVGMGADYARNQGKSIFVADLNVSYRREAHAGDELAFEIRLLGRNDRRLHLFHTMRRGSDPALLATCELMCVHVDLESRRSAAFAPDRASRLDEVLASQAHLPQPEGVGRVIISLP